MRDGNNEEGMAKDTNRENIETTKMTNKLLYKFH